MRIRNHTIPTGLRRLTTVLALLTLLLSMSIMSCTCRYMKMDPPADVDKAFLNNNNSCYLATASNMLAGAGYGNGTTLQARADDIYSQMTANYGTADGGWTDAALSWWLTSPHNTWTTNPYTVVTVYGNKSPKYPWANAQGAQDIGNELRVCNFVGLSISWPTNSVGAGGVPVIGSGGHAITSWGDNVTDATLIANPGSVRVTDSDRDVGGDVQSYAYDAYTNPNPGGANEGDGWYFDFDNNHPYIKHIVVLSPIQNSSGGVATQKVVGSYKIHQTRDQDATDLHYRVSTDVNILSYRTKIDWTTDPSPTITESSPRRSIAVEWDLSRKTVPKCTWVTITTEFILPSWNAMWYDSLYFTYPNMSIGRVFPSIHWEMKSPVVEKAETIRNVTGGYVIGSFRINDPNQPADSGVVGEYRFIHEYSFRQNPELHTLLISGEKGYVVSDLRIGHSYGYPGVTALWEFDQWMTEMKGKQFNLSEKPASISIDWKGRLPYPEGEDIKGRIPEKEQPQLKQQ